MLFMLITYSNNNQFKLNLFESFLYAKMLGYLKDFKGNLLIIKILLVISFVLKKLVHYPFFISLNCSGVPLPIEGRT